MLDHRQQYDDTSFTNTTTLLTLNPEFYTIWNIRREILEHWGLDTDKVKRHLAEDLKMVMAMLKRFPKCYWVWNHRRWCLLSLKDDANWEKEFALVLMLLDLDIRNFHGWQYRRFVVSQIELGQRPEQQLATDLKEFEYTTLKILGNISNFSAWHNRSQLIPKIITRVHELNVTDQPMFSDPEKLMANELELVTTGMYMDSSDTSVWTYLQWLVTDPLLVTELKQRGVYETILRDQLAKVKELDDLELDENGKHDVWCLKSMVLITALLNREAQRPIVDENITEWLNLLVELDPQRHQRYRDQLLGRNPVISTTPTSVTS